MTKLRLSSSRRSTLSTRAAREAGTHGVIVIISHPQDLHAERVMEVLRREGREVLLLDLSHLPNHATVAIEYGGDGLSRLEYRSEGQGVFDLTRACSVWWRRPQSPDLSSVTDGDVLVFTHNEWQEATNGLWQLIDAPWMNPPGADDVAARKLHQLKVAAGLGLRIPRTMVTSDPDAARSFIDREGIGRTIYKTFSCTHQVWRETRLVGLKELDLLDKVRLAPVIFQEYVQAAADLRVTVVGSNLFVGEIDSSDTDYPVDFRMSLGQSRVASGTLPDAVSQRLLALVERLGLVYGAIDLRRTPDGDHVFLEINTAGEFLFVEERTGLPITQAVADWLARPAAPPR